MLIQTTLFVVGKVESTSQKDGDNRTYHTINYSQNDGEIIGHVSVSAETYAQVEKGKTYTFDAKYSVWNSSGYISIIGIHNPTSKGGAI